MGKLQSQIYRICIDTCNECFEACEMCAVKCLREDDVKSMAKCIELCNTCSHACVAASLVMSGDSEYSKDVCGMCAEVCNACSVECGKHQDMEHCKQCAEVCRRCAEECRKIAGGS